MPRSHFVLLTGWMGLLGAYSAVAAKPDPTAGVTPFAIRVIDDQTQRGVPLVELRTTSNQTYLTDSNGYVAIDDPTLMGQKVFFHLSSHGYEHAQDGFGYRGTALQVVPGGERTVPIRRINVAERLYRITGAGIYRDSVKLGKPVPTEKPLLNAFVTGQDSVQTAIVGERIFWFWGDTDRLQYPLGQFNTSGAVSRLPRAGGLDPADGINLQYYVDESGFSRPMFQRENGILIWVHGVFAVEEPAGTTRILTHYSRRKSLALQLSHGLAAWNAERNLFEPILEYAVDAPLFPRGHAFRVRKQQDREDREDRDYIYFADPYALIRCPASWADAIKSAQYEAFTPLKAGSHVMEPSQLDRNADGTLNYAWKRNTSPVDARQHDEWVRNEVIKVDEAWLRTVDAATGKPIMLHRGSIHWNEFRRRWIMIAHESGGTTSFLGEVWYAEAREPEGPFTQAVKIVTHDDYSFYNVAHHDFFDQQQGRFIYFEGTFTSLFTKRGLRTPWYDYNQIMYRLDLADPRLAPAQVQ